MTADEAMRVENLCYEAICRKIASGFPVDVEVNSELNRDFIRTNTLFLRLSSAKVLTKKNIIIKHNELLFLIKYDFSVSSVFKKRIVDEFYMDLHLCNIHPSLKEVPIKEEREREVLDDPTDFLATRFTNYLPALKTAKFMISLQFTHLEKVLNLDT